MLCLGNVHYLLWDRGGGAGKDGGRREVKMQTVGWWVVL